MDLSYAYAAVCHPVVTKPYNNKHCGPASEPYQPSLNVKALLKSMVMDQDPVV
jgi:hypothetical protein